MTKTIDVHDLGEEDTRFIQRLVELLRQQNKTRKAEAKAEAVDEKDFAAHASDVIGEVSRREIYDYL